MANNNTQQALPFTITVLEGDLATTTLQNGEAPGVIKLRGRAMPYRPVPFGGEMRRKTTYYPGNPVATQQLIGPTEKPMTLAGQWKDIFLGDGQARLLANLFDDIRRRGPLLRFQWGAGVADASSVAGGVSQSALAIVGSDLVREGILARFEFKPDRPQDVPWEMEFDWRGQGDTPIAPVGATGAQNPYAGTTDAAQALLDTSSLLQAFNDYQSTQYGLPDSIESAVENIQTNLESAVDALQNASAFVTANINLPFAEAGRIIDAGSLAESTLVTLASTILSVPLLALEVKDDAADLLDLQDQILTLLQDQSASLETTKQATDGIIANVIPDVIAEVRPVPGTDLRDLARKYYGDADAWFAIADYNNIVGTEVPTPPSGPSDDPARPIQIPRLQSTTSDIRQVC